MKHDLRWSAPVLALALAPFAAARADSPGPARAASATPPYVSAFADYKPWHDIKPGDWPALNAAAAGGGMAGMHGMEPGRPMSAMPGMSASSAPAAHPPASAASAPAHVHHPLHGGRR